MDTGNVQNGGLKSLSDKAMLVKLTTSRATLTKRDIFAESFVQTAMDDASLIVNRKLFRDAGNPINKIMAATSEVYAEHKRRTLPYIDKGPRILPNDEYFEYTSVMRQKIASVDALMAEHIPNYDACVQLDIQDRSRGKPNTRASVDDYPTAEEFQSRMGFDLRFMPLPDAKHFLFDISDTDMEKFNATMDQVAMGARTEVIKKMLEPLQHLVEKLNRPIGTEGAIFRNSAVENVMEGVRMAQRLNVAKDEDISMMADMIGGAVARFSDNTDVLRESPIVREQAARKLDEIAKQMGALYGA